MMRSRKTIRLMAAGLAAAFIGTMAGDVALAQGAGMNREEYLRRYYMNNRQDDDYRDWRRGRWSDDDYRRWYRRHHGGDRFSGSDAATAALFGLAVGGILGGALSGGVTGSAARPSAVPPAGGYEPFSRGYVTYCSNRYRSFDPNSGTFIGNDGQRHYCR